MRRLADVCGSWPRLARVWPIALVVWSAPALGADAVAAPGGPGWSIQSVAQPTNFSAAGGGWELIVTNVGSQPSRAGVPVMIADELPAGVRVANIRGREVETEAGFTCTTVPLQCVGGEVPAGGTVVVSIGAELETGAKGIGAFNTASVSGGGAPAVTTREATAFGSEPAPFGIESFSLQAFEVNGSLSAQAAGRPYTLATSIYFASDESGGNVSPAAEVKDVIVDLPLGLVGDPQATPKCPLDALLQQTEETACPPASRVGTVVFEAFPGGTFRASGAQHSETTAVYNMQPEPGFPAEFGFTYLGKAVYMYASTVRIGGQLRLRVTVPGIPSLSTIGTTLMFFGNPGGHFGEAGGAQTPFFTSPADCEAGPLTATAEADSWGNPANQHGNVYAFAESTTYPQLTDCNLLQFQPTLTVRPDTPQADEPSGYTFTVANQQNESPATPGTPPLKEATVTLPAGVSISPSAADGLRTCAATGKEGIDIGNGQTLGAGQPGGGEDTSDNGEATELGAGHLGGNGSPYDDGLYHTAPGHCPLASTIGSVEVETPLLPTPLQGHIFIAEPGCGGSGQPECTSSDALNGDLFGAYLEVSGDGTIVKLAGHVSVNPGNGQITASFRENPQVPFSAIRLRLYGGPRAALANPQACGSATTAGNFSAWSAPATLDVQAFSQFAVDWDGAGGGCPAELPFAPSLVAQTTNPDAGAFSPFTLTLSRGDRQQYLSQVTATTPQGLLALLPNVTLCGEPQAQRGECQAASRVGTVTVAAGAGSHPLSVQGSVYLTTGYHGAPFGLSIVVPAEAGPFHLGRPVVVRGAITIDPNTAQVTITSDALPQMIDGVPLRVQTANVTVEHEKFVFNPTGCTARQVAVTVTGAQGGSAHLSSPFAAANCRTLPFAPKFTTSTRGSTSKQNGASLDVKVLSTTGQANIASAFVTLPKQLPARLTTIQQACLAATFEANPAICPAGSLIGVAKAITPVLPVPLEGPAYLVSHGGAAFPDIVVILQGDGTRVDLTGHIDIAKGITSSTFAAIPDAPITSFELKLPESQHSGLTTDLAAKAHGNLCAATKLAMPTTLTGQNGAQVKQSTKIAVTGCPTKPKKKARKASTRRASSRGGSSARSGRR